MAYTPYASAEDFQTLFPDITDVSDADLLQASRHIDSLTYNRIVSIGYEQLTSFQQEIIKEVCCRQARFEVENADVISTVLSSYSINGVAMQFGDSWNIFTDHGVAMQKDLYSLLCQTGLCVRTIGGW